MQALYFILMYPEMGQALHVALKVIHCYFASLFSYRHNNPSLELEHSPPHQRHRFTMCLLISSCVHSRHSLHAGSHSASSCNSSVRRRALCRPYRLNIHAGRGRPDLSFHGRPHYSLHPFVRLSVCPVFAPNSRMRKLEKNGRMLKYTAQYMR